MKQLRNIGCERQDNQVFEAILILINKGYSPSNEEIADVSGMSLGSVHAALARLEGKKIRRKKNKNGRYIARSIEVLTPKKRKLRN